jgi:hypothetical protein
VTIFRDDEDWRTPHLRIVAVNVTIISPDNSSKIDPNYALSDDMMIVPEALTDVTELVRIPLKDAQQKIISYVNSHIGCKTSDIIFDLGLDPDLVLQCLNELETSKRIRSKNIDSE